MRKVSSKTKARKTKRKSENTLRKGYKYRIYPNNAQKKLFAETFGHCRFIWNKMLSDKTDYYKEFHKILHCTPAQYKEEFPWLKDVDSSALCNVQMDLQQAYASHFNNPKNFKLPKFKKKKGHVSYQSYKTNCTNNNIRLLTKGVKLPKAGIVKAKIHRLPPSDMVLKSATVSKTASDKYYVSLLFEKPFEYPEPVNIHTAKAVGLDYKSDGLYADSEGNVCGSPKFYRKAYKKLAREQRRLARKVKGSKNYEKQRLKVAVLYEHTAFQREDFLQKLSTEKANQYDIICVENLNMKAMSNKGFGLGKATLDNGWGKFIRLLEYKLKLKGGQVVVIDKWFPSSQTCHKCGTVHPEVKDLSVRKWKCPDCGTLHDRDENAAINILCEGLRTRIAA